MLKTFKLPYDNLEGLIQAIEFVFDPDRVKNYDLDCFLETKDVFIFFLTFIIFRKNNILLFS